MKNENSKKALLSLVTVGLMSALVYVGNYLSIPLPNEARVHLGNSLCLLAGLLFGGLKGGLSSGIGASLYDLFSPVYFTSAPYTFFSKFAMGFTAGLLRTRIKNEKVGVIIAAVVGQIVYIILYLGKKIVGQLMLGAPLSTAIAAVSVNAASSAVNGILACIISVPLYFALSAALKHTGFAKLMGKTEHTES